MSRPRNARHASLPLIVLAAAVLWTAGQGVRAAANDRAEKSATPVTGTDNTVSGATAKTAAPAPKATPQGQKMTGPAMTPQEMMRQKIKPAQRQAAADRLKAAKKAAGGGITPLAYTGPALVTDPTTSALVPDYFGGTPNWAFSPQPYMCTANALVDPPACGGLALGTIIGTGLRKFIDNLPDWTTQIAKPDTVTYPGSDYYEIELSEFSTKFHTDLPNTRLRVYKQTNNGTDLSGSNTVAPPPASYLGPVIVALKGRPTRVRFTNKLPLTGSGGELFIPTDTSVMGAGVGPDGINNYPQNRGTLHLHGGFTPWISDGTPHQWVTPANEGGTLIKGVSTQPVPDMVLPAGDSMYFYWPNQQSGRLMFYHDHALGITRLNVYAGEAAGYLLTDPVERGLNGTLSVVDEFPLVIQDRTFVWGTRNTAVACGQPDPTATGTFATDPTWCDPARKWAQDPGSLWFPHVYMPNQNPWDISGANGMGRWDYALWFWPPFTGLIAHPTVPNPYAADPGQPPEIPGTPNPSLVPEAFMDTPVVNGTAYPTTQVPAGLVRLRILNAANDRFQNLSLWVAADKTTQTTATPIPGLPTTATRLCTPASGAALANCTEVKMVPFNSTTPGGFPPNWYTPGNPIVFDDRAGGVPDPATRGPAMIQIGTEGGLLPAPAVILNQPVNFTYNPKNIVVLSVEQHALLLGPAERADVLVDFGPFAGHTLILYNDAPAPIPAYDQRLDYYTGGGGLDQTATGGTTMTIPGFGPNTRTVMRFEVAAGSGAGGVDYVNPTLCTAAAPVVGVPGPVGCTAGTLGPALAAAFRASQDPIIVPQAAYNAAYGTTVTNSPGANASRISDTSLTFAPLASTCLPGTTTACALGSLLTAKMQPKAIQELFELDYGRMNATLGVELPFTNGGNQTTLPMGYIEPATEILDASAAIAAPVAGDGTQIWKITHNGVDTHAIHFHLFNVQVINRVGWDGAIRMPDLNELGWKETVRTNPLEDIIVAMRPTTPQLPFGLPDSVRLLAPALAPGTLIDTFDTITGNPMSVANAPYNFGWEYVWHCHLLGHEENDMMRPVVFNAPRLLPAAPVVSYARTSGTVTLTWTDGTPFNYTTGLPTTTLGNAANEIGFLIQRAPVGSNGKPGAYVQIGTALANVTSFIDSGAGTATWSYGVIAYNAAGNATSAAVTVSGALQPPAAPTNMVATLQAGPQIRLTWTDNATNETNFALERQVGGVWTALATLGANVVTYTDTTVTAGNTYTYRVKAVNGAGSSAYATSSPVTLPAAPAAPATFTATAARANGNNDRVTLIWTDVATETGYTIQSATNAAFTAGLTTSAVAANTTTLVQTVKRGLSLYYRIRATNSAGASAWKTATPLPIATP